MDIERHFPAHLNVQLTVVLLAELLLQAYHHSQASPHTMLLCSRNSEQVLVWPLCPHVAEITFYRLRTQLSKMFDDWDKMQT